MFGDWLSEDIPARIEDGELKEVTIKCEPVDHEPRQGFAMVGTLSQMISREFMLLTSEEDSVNHLTAGEKPRDRSALIPRDYRGKVLKLWRFELKPHDAIGGRLEDGGVP